MRKMMAIESSPYETVSNYPQRLGDPDSPLLLDVTERNDRDDSTNISSEPK
jgi:hypothetical protein